MSRNAHVKRAKLMRLRIWVPKDFPRMPFKPWEVEASSGLNEHRRYLAGGGKFLRRKTVLRVQRQLSYYQGK